MRKFIYDVLENEFGSSTSCEVFVNNNGVVTNINDTSTFQTDYEWDGWNVNLATLKGKPFTEVDNILCRNMEGYKDAYRHPYVSQYEDKSTFFKNLSEQVNSWKEDGYEDLAEKLEQHVHNCSHTSWGGTVSYEIKKISIIKTPTKDLAAKITLTTEDTYPLRIENLSIKDKLTGSTSPLDTKGVELKGLSGSQIKDLMNGKKISHYDIAGNMLGQLGLNKTPAGWTFSISKKIVNAADSEAGI